MFFFKHQIYDLFGKCEEAIIVPLFLWSLLMEYQDFPCVCMSICMSIWPLQGQTSHVSGPTSQASGTANHTSGSARQGSGSDSQDSGQVSLASSLASQASGPVSQAWWMDSRTIQISNVFYITKRSIPYIHLHTWWKTWFDRELIGPFGSSLQMERLEKFKAGCKRILEFWGEPL